MSRQDLHRFIFRIGTEPDLQVRIRRATSADEVIAIASQLGWEVTPSGMASLLEEVPDDAGKLSEEELEAVSGGAGPVVAWSAVVSDLRRIFP